MRIYLPATMADLAAVDGLTARQGHIVTAGLRAELGAGDDESAEHAALLLAAEDSLTLLTESESESESESGSGSGSGSGSESSDIRAAAPAPPRRVVVAADIDPLPVPPGRHVAIPAPAVPWSRVVSFHVDDVDDPQARQILTAAATGDDEAAGAATDLDLLWYDVSERLHLLDQNR